MLGPKFTGAFTVSGNCPLQQWPQLHLTCIIRWSMTFASIGRGMSTSCLLAPTVAESISRGLPHTGQTAAGYQRSVAVTSSVWNLVLPGCPFCPPVFFPEGLRGDCV